MPGSYTGVEGNVPADRSDVVGATLIGADARNSTSINAKLQAIYDRLQRVWKKAGFLDIASTWTAAQTFNAMTVTTLTATTGNLTTSNVTTANLTTANIGTANITTLTNGTPLYLSSSTTPALRTGYTSPLNQPNGRPLALWTTPLGEVHLAGTLITATSGTVDPVALIIPSGLLPATNDTTGSNWGLLHWFCWESTMAQATIASLRADSGAFTVGVTNNRQYHFRASWRINGP